jgi:hypothetical protein
MANRYAEESREFSFETAVERDLNQYAWAGSIAAGHVELTNPAN